MINLYAYKCRNCAKIFMSLYDCQAQRQAEAHMLEKGHIVENASDGEIAKEVKKTDEFLNRHPDLNEVK